jgi:hypothetical protein
VGWVCERLLHLACVKLGLLSADDFAPDLPPNSPERRENPALWAGLR